MLMACACWRYMPHDSTSAVAEQYAAYSAYINSRLMSSSDTVGGPGRQIVICSDSTSLRQKPVWRFFAAAIRGLNGNIGTAYSLFIMNMFSSGRETWHFGQKFTLVRPYELASSRELPKLIKLADKRKQSIFTFSTVAFNNNFSEGLFYTSHHCGSLCGEEWYVIMRKIRGKWTIVGQALMGVS